MNYSYILSFLLLLINIVYSKDNVYNGCGVSAGNRPCKQKRNTTTPVITKTITKTTVGISTTITTSSSSSSSVPTKDPDAVPQWIYNPSINKCLFMQTKNNQELLVKDCEDNAKFNWYVSPSFSKGYIFSINRRCLKNVNDVIKVGPCDSNDVFEMENGLIHPTEDKTKCLTASNPEEDSVGVLKSCNYSDDIKWVLWNENPADYYNVETKTVWIYNKKLNKCLYFSDVGSRPIMKDCDDSEMSKWEIPTSEYGFIKSKYYDDHCLNLIKYKSGSIAIKPCGMNSILDHINNNIVSEGKCLGLLDSNKSGENRLNFNECDKSKDDQYWEFSDTLPSSSVPKIESDAVGRWIYNPSINKCLFMQTKNNQEPLVKDCGSNLKFKWYVSPSFSKGYIFSSNGSRCLKNIDGVIKVGTCDSNDVFEMEKGLIYPTEDKNKCLTASNPEEDSVGVFETCNNSSNMKWVLWNENPADYYNAETKTVWIYNKKLNKCLYFSNIRSRPIMKDCDDSEMSKWEVPTSEYGFIKSKYYDDHCLDVIKYKLGTVAIEPCSINSILDYSNNNIVSEGKCLGLLDSNKSGENRLNFNECDKSKDDQYWEFSDTLPN